MSHYSFQALPNLYVYLSNNYLFTCVARPEADSGPGQVSQAPRSGHQLVPGQYFMK